MYEFEVNKRNNLIFYGIQSESRETPAMLLSKVRKETKIFFKIKMKSFLGDKSSEDQHEYKEGNYGKKVHNFVIGKMSLANSQAIIQFLQFKF